MAHDIGELAHRLLDAAKTAGADASDAVVFSSESLSVEVRAGALEHAERSENTEAGLRVFLGSKQACVSTSDLREDMIAELADRAVAMARVAPDDPHAGLAEPGQLAQDRDASVLDLADPATPPGPETLQDIALQAEAAARAVPGVAQVQDAGAATWRSAGHLATSTGFSGGSVRTGSSFHAVAIAGEGLEMERDHASEARAHFADLPDIDTVGHRAGQRAVDRFGAVKPPTGTFPVLYDERVAGSLIGHLVSAANGSAVARGSSWLADALGTEILPPTLSLREDPTRPRIGGSQVFDAEGLPARPRDIIRDGVLQGWTLDLATARKLGMDSTGNAGRTPSAPPYPSVGNLALTQGTQSREDLIRDMGTGLLVTSMIGATISPTTGDYSRGASGFWVENGVISHPVNECTIAGNLRDMLARIIPANDARTHLSRVIPSLLVEGMTIAGA